MIRRAALLTVLLLAPPAAAQPVVLAETPKPGDAARYTVELALTGHLIVLQENGKQQIKLDYLRTKKAALILRAVNHKLRQQMIRLIDEYKQITVTELYVKLRLEQSVASQHLAILRRAGIVTTVRDGKFIYYSVNYPRVTEVVKYVDDLLS